MSSRNKNTTSGSGKSLSAEVYPCGCRGSADMLPELVDLYRSNPDSDSPNRGKKTLCTQCQIKTNDGITELIKAVASAPAGKVGRKELQYLALVTFWSYGRRPEQDSDVPWVAVVSDLEQVLYDKRKKKPLSGLLGRLKRGLGPAWTASVVQGLALAAVDEYEWMISMGELAEPEDPTHSAATLAGLRRDVADMETGGALEGFILSLRTRYQVGCNKKAWSPRRLYTVFQQLCPEYYPVGESNSSEQ